MAAAALVLCAGFAVAAVWASRGGAGRTAGPIRVGTPSGIYVVARGVGKPFTIGAIELQTPGGAPAQVDTVSLVGAQAGIRLVHAYVAEAPGDTGKQGAWAATRRWPPPGETLSALGGRLVEPHSAGSSTSALQVVLELELVHARQASFQGVQIAYHVGSHRYRQVWPLAVRGCLPTVARCQAPAAPGS